MKFGRGGFLPRVPGRPSRHVDAAPLPERLVVELRRDGLTYVPAVRDSERVAFGAPLAWAEANGGRVALPAPAAGTVTIDSSDTGSAGSVVLNVTSHDIHPLGTPCTPERTTAEAMRQALAEAGIWPLIWSSRTGAMPALDGSETPNRILVNFVAAEPFRARGKVIWGEYGQNVTAGLRYLPRLLTEYGIINLTLTELDHPVAQRIRQETAGHAWIHIESVPVRYPVEHPRVLCQALRQSDPRFQREDVLWILDVQAVQAIGGCMTDGIPLHERVIAVGGPGASNPRHVRARIGTGIDRLLERGELTETKRVLRGGLFRGRPVDAAAAVGYDDDAVFVLPRPEGREFLGFAKPGFDRTSFLPCFASQLTTAAADRRLTTSLRGERRPCIACGLCEDACPMGLLPQVLHRYLYRDAIDEAERTGLPLCIGCGLCSYVCPSKLELRKQFSEAQVRLREEREQAAAAEAAHKRQEEAFLREKEHSEDWRK